ncbi:MAG: HIT domain-containing protein [Nitrospinaceae bacterium]|nr:HIT domain-containing protein [Nitrospinaceae bacterium]NIR57428.1 HIT domain-containing protein [Nitrospinaceae bacterium]NIS87887.1 HIT domain-containing protein [Nitrospinaceae bacterium]NIT84756.1 HIT domain-containing protein [Nitrospinaceae bacterium]NIU46931.1 HIT domain-containing protein [Nitrospinaceae bacterium]
MSRSEDARKQIWAPWRMEYIKLDKSGECIFCTLPPARKDEKNFILYKGPECFVIMNIYPYNTGHVMVSPYRHVDCLTKLHENELLEVNHLTRTCVAILREVINPDGFNIGLNLGKAAGAGYDEHLHVHIVPRWTGDTNFMPVLADIKVHPEHLRSTYEKIRPAFQKIES